MSLNQLLNPAGPNGAANALDIIVNNEMCAGDIEIGNSLEVGGLSTMFGKLTLFGGLDMSGSFLNTGSKSLTIAGGDIDASNNVASISSPGPSDRIIIDEKIVNYDPSHPEARCRTYTSSRIGMLSASSITTETGILTLRLTDPEITTTMSKVICQAGGGGVVNISGTDRAGNFYMDDVPGCGEGFVDLKFISVFGALKTNTQYTLDFTLSLVDLP